MIGAFRFDFHTAPGAIRLRLRQAEGALPKRVLVNGKPVTAEGEWICLPVTARTLDVTYGAT